METNYDIMNLINRIEVKTVKVVLDYIDCGIVNNNCDTNYIVYMNMIQRFLIDNEGRNSDFFLNYSNNQIL